MAGSSGTAYRKGQPRLRPVLQLNPTGPYSTVAWSLPESLLYRDGQSKGPLCQALARHIPTGLFDRPKSGFGLPLDSWLRGPLRDWAESLPVAKDLETDGLLDSRPILARRRQHATEQVH